MVKAQRHASSDLKHDGSSGDWFFDVNKGGGYLIEQSVHNLDACNWVIGAHPTRACGFGGILLYKNDPPGRTIFDCGHPDATSIPAASRCPSRRTCFSPRGMPGGSQYIYVYGSKGAVDLLGNATLYPAERGGKPSQLSTATRGEDDQYAHIVRFYECILKGGKNPSDITIGATAALTSILGHEAMVKETVVKWSDMGVDV